jgi:hypothetical protein
LGAGISRQANAGDHGTVNVQASIVPPTGTPTKALAHFCPVSDCTEATAEIIVGVPAPHEFPVSTTR